MAQFFRTLVSTNSKIDSLLRHEESLSETEYRGLSIFLSEKGDCFHGHSIPLFCNNTYHNIGLDPIFAGANMGRYHTTANPTDLGKFKTPTLRNVALTAPYMHDGRFATLEEVVEHYNSGIKRSASAGPLMTKSGKEFGLMLTVQEKTDLANFLKTFIDSSFISSPALANPF